jgi:hypothetical protein
MDRPPRATAKRQRDYSALRSCALIGALKETVEPRPLTDPDTAARKLMEIANAFEPVQDGRIYIEEINAPNLSAIQLGNRGDRHRE